MIHLRTLGATDVRTSRGDEVRAVLAQPKRLALLAYLAVARPRGFHQKDTLRALFWPEADDHHARRALNRAVYFLRHALGDDVLVGGRGDSVAVAREALWCDAVAFEDDLDAGRVEAALELYRGDLLAGFFVSASPDFEHWLDHEREHLRQRAGAAALSLAHREELGGNVLDAARWAARATEISPYAEGGIRRLLALLDLAGDRAEAVRVYHEFARRLEAELGVAPSPETRSLVDEIRARAEPILGDDDGAGNRAAGATGLPSPPAAPAPPRRHAPVLRAVATLGGLALAVSLTTLGLSRIRAHSAPADTTIRVAVIPFANGNPGGTDYLNVGITEELVTRIAKLPGMTVIAPVSASRNAERATEDVRRFAADLGIRAVLRGSVTQSNGRVRIAARLLDPRTDETLWADTFDRELRDILDVQADIARRIAEALAVTVGEADGATTHVLRRAPRTAGAYVAYLKGRYFLGKRTAEGLKKAIEFFSDAVARDSEYALAYTGLADAHGLLSAHGGARGTDRPSVVLATGRRFALRAVGLDSALPEARLSLAFFRHWQEWDWEGARVEYERAIRLDPQNANARQWYALLLRDLGRLDEASRELRRALELDPLSPTINRNLGYVLFCMGRADEAIEQLHKTLELDPGFPLVHEWLRNVYAEVGRYDEALAEQVKVATLRGWRAEEIGALRIAYGSKGWRGVLERMLTRAMETSRHQYVSPAVLAARHAQLGRTDDAFRFLEQAYGERDLGLVSLKTNPLYRNLRADPRFAALEHRMGLPE